MSRESPSVRIGAAVAASALFVMLSSQPAGGATRRALLSVSPGALPGGQSLVGFNITTWGVEVLALCRIPRSWEIRFETFENAEGFIVGKADSRGGGNRELRQLMLVDLYDHQPLPKALSNGVRPASFAGWIEIADHPLNPATRRTLKPGDFQLANAARCPEPAPPRP